MLAQLHQREYQSIVQALAMMWDEHRERHPTPWLLNLTGRRYGYVNTVKFIQVARYVGRRLGWYNPH